MALTIMWSRGREIKCSEGKSRTAILWLIQVARYVDVNSQ